MKNEKMLLIFAAFLILGVSACKKNVSDLIDATANYPNRRQIMLKVRI